MHAYGCHKLTTTMADVKVITVSGLNFSLNMCTLREAFFTCYTFQTPENLFSPDPLHHLHPPLFL